MRPSRSALAAAILFLAASTFASPAHAEAMLPAKDLRQWAPPPWPIVAVSDEDEENFDIDLIVSMSGKCTTFRIAGQSLACRAVKYFHGTGGRAYFTIAVDDPADAGHVISFSGDKANREKNQIYELAIDQMLLNSRERPKVNGLHVPRVESSNGMCRQLGDIEKKQITTISCLATDKDGRRYELQFEADSEPIIVQRITQGPVQSVKRRQRLRTLIACRRKAAQAQILPRDSTSYLIQCLEEGVPASDADDQ
jgi:hypothetical protein